MNIVTAADADFFHCVKELAESVRRVYGKPILLYDLGITEEQKQQLDATIIPIVIPEKVSFKGKNSSIGIPQVRHTHKPFCVRHYFENFSEPMILVDADCLFTEKVEETGFDVGITCNKMRRQKIYLNGGLNSGVIFFNNPARKLVDQWAIECEKENISDQKALANLLNPTINLSIFNKVQDWNGLKIKMFNARIYNEYHLTKKGKILHFIASKHNKDIYTQLIEGYRQGKDIRKIFNRIKRGKKGLLERIGRFLGLKKD